MFQFLFPIDRYQLKVCSTQIEDTRTVWNFTFWFNVEIENLNLTVFWNFIRADKVHCTHLLKKFKNCAVILEEWQDLSLQCRKEISLLLSTIKKGQTILCMVFQWSLGVNFTMQNNFFLIVNPYCKQLK